MAAGISWVITERRPPAPERRFNVHPRISFPHALFQRILPYYNRFKRSARPAFAIILATVVATIGKANRLARRNAKLTVGAAAAAAVIAAAVAAGVSGGSAPAPADRVAAASQHVAAKDAADNHAAKQDTAKSLAAKTPAKTAKTPAKTNSGNSGAGKSSSQHGAAKHATPQHGRSNHGAANHGAANHGAANHGAANHGASNHGASNHGAANHGASNHGAAPAHHKAPARKPYLIYDSVTPSALPAHNAAATYATGNYAASPSQVAGHKTVMWIDVTGYDHSASVLDVEPGDATPSMAASWAWHRLHDNPKALARIYTMRSQWPAVKAAIGHLPANMRSHVRYWIADPTGSPHIVPGSDATQWYWGKSYDISTATPRF
jgi:pentapeptide repeat protein